MQIDQHRERLRERISLLATLVESALVTTVASAAERCFGNDARLMTVHDEIAALAHVVHAEGIEFLVRFRPVATDLQFATAALACCADLQVAAVAVEGFASLMDGVQTAELAESVPSLDRLVSCVQLVVTLAADALGAWDGAAYDELREVRADVASMRERVREEVMAAVVKPRAAVERLIAVDAAACMLERVVAVAAACVRRLARTGAVEPALSLESI